MIRAGLTPVSILITTFVLLMLPAPAHSQVSVAAGYQAVHLPDNWVTAGFNVDVAGGVAGAWDIVGEFGLAHDGGGDFNDGFNLFNLGGGERWNPRRDGPAPFAQLLAGVQLSRADIDRDTAFMLQPGAGIHFPINDRWGLSAQFDYRPVFYQEETVNETRFVIGARWTRP
jgi:hypothetical protein